jgi:hypothetical protein
MTIFPDLREKAGLSLAQAQALLQLSVDTATEYENGARLQAQGGNTNSQRIGSWPESEKDSES